MNEHLDYLESTKARVLQTVARFEEKDLDKNNFCVMPFVNIILEPNGSIGLCRHKGTEFSFGNIATQTIDEIWTSQTVQNWREGLLNGKNQICKTELVDRKCNLCPELNSLLDHADISNTKNPKILRLTANLNGKCNLQCQFCDVWSMPNGFYTEENFWIPARKRFFREIREVDMLSGEPFIQPDTYRLIDEVSDVNPDCQWTLTTNLHWKLTDKVKSKLDKIVVKNIIASIDSLDEETYHRIRKPGNLNVVLKTLDDMKAYEAERIAQGKSELNIRVNFLIQKDNWREAQKMIQFCLEKKVIPFITFLYIPDEFSLLTLPTSERVEILNFYFKTLSKDELLLSQRVLKPLIRSLDKFDYAYFMEMFHERIIH